MSCFRVLSGIGATLCVAVSVSLLAASGAFAAGSVHLCVGEEAGSPVRSGGATGSCKAKETPVALPSSEADQQTLLSIASHAKYIESGVASKPTIQFSGVNVQVVNGAGSTKTINGEGNLVIGYDETSVVEGLGFCGTPLHPIKQEGSHNLILGTDQIFTGFGGLEAGTCDEIAGEFATATGWENDATGPYSSVGGGAYGTASGKWASVSGGFGNKASSEASWVGGGGENQASGGESSISGGHTNSASAGDASISGGFENVANQAHSWVGGGYKNHAEGEFATVDGGLKNTAAGGVFNPGSWIGGGHENIAEGEASSVSGGNRNKATGTYSSILGGEENTASGDGSSVSGGKTNTALPDYSSILGGKGNSCAGEFCHFP